MSKNKRSTTTTTMEPIQEGEQMEQNENNAAQPDVAVQDEGVQQEQVHTTAQPEDSGNDDSNAEGTTTEPPVNSTTQPPEQPAEKKKLSKKDAEQLAVFETRIEWLKENGSVHEQHVVTVLENYVEVCSKSIDLNAIGVEQQRLWRLFEYIHNQPTEFRKLFTIVVEFAKKYKEEAFSLTKFYRAQSSLNLAADRLSAFNNIRTLIINTVESTDRSRVKAIIDIRKIIEVDCIPEHVRAQYIAYYN